MKKILLFIILLFIPLVFFRAEEPEIYSENVFLYNVNEKEVMYEKNSDEKIYIASLTKMMTVLVAIENIEDINEMVAFPEIDYDYLLGYTQVGFEEGQEVTYKDLLNAALLASGADATEALAILVSENKSDFIELMNKKAEEIGLNATSFSNTMGKDGSRNYSTVKDVFKLLNYALKNETFYKIFTTLKYTPTAGEKIYSTLYYYNKKANLNTDGIIGLKTGYTSGAGLCMASLFEKNNIKYILVTANAPYSLEEPYQVMDAVSIDNYYYDNYKYINLIEKGDLITTLKLAPFGIKEEIYADKTITDYLIKDKDITYEYEGTIKINGKTHIGDILGEYKIYYDGKEVGSVDVKVEDNFKNKFWIFISKYMWYFIAFVAFIIGIKRFFRKKKRRN